jgi:hypothetical protein
LKNSGQNRLPTVSSRLANRISIAITISYTSARHFPVIPQNRYCKRLNRSRDEQYQAFCNLRTGDSPQESRHLGRHHCLARFAGLQMCERRL